MKVSLVVLMVSLVVCLTILSPFATAQGLPRNLKTWTLEYAAGGGMQPGGMSLKLTQASELDISNIAESNVRTHATSQLMTKVQDFLKVAHQARPAIPSPDQPYDELVLTSRLFLPIRHFACGR